MSTERRGAAATASWLDPLKGLAMAWIFLNHVSERLFGAPYAANPAAGWPPLHDRVAQLYPLHGHGALDPLLDVLRWVGWAGDQGVQLFIIASGFGLTWGLLARSGGGGIDVGDFYRRRAIRIYPLWWAAHLLFLPAFLMTRHVRIDLDLLLSLLAIRVTPHLLYFLVPSWWYVGCLVQLYLLFPALWGLLRRLGTGRFLLVTLALSFAIRGAGLLLLHDDLDWWSRGGIAVGRLPEFVLGMALAAWMHARPDAAMGRLRTPGTLLAAVVAYVVGTVLSVSLVGMTIAPSLLGAAAFVLAMALLTFGGRDASHPVARWIGRHSYSLFLVHQPLIWMLVPQGLDGGRAVWGSVAALVATPLIAVALETAVDGIIRLRRRVGLVRLAGGLATSLLVVYGALLGAEMALRRYDPQEAGGWGERPSLEPHPVFGWRMVPDTSTRLRWDGYDYRATSNRLGFPAPEYPEPRPAGTFRVLVTGDAFTSPEGVDTEQGWARGLEAELEGRLPGRHVEVLNFAITGYGPNQFAVVAETFVPRYRPQVVIVESFVNDCEDAMTSDDEFRASIGFGEPPQDGPGAVLRLTNLVRYLRVNLAGPVVERLVGRPRGQGYAFGGFAALVRGETWATSACSERVIAALRRIRAAADAVGARLAIVMVPAAVQVCGPDDLPYFPRVIDLGDASRWDVEQPQRAMAAMARDVGATFVDLRPALRSLPACPYARRNMHWTREGHRVVARAVAQALAGAGLLPASP